jgi:gamma-glutamyltranspeptidase/glutathione hydrolase
MVAAANPVAVDAGLKVLREGGSAVDAAVAVQAVLGLVEPQSSGLGGGSFMFLRRQDQAGDRLRRPRNRSQPPPRARLVLAPRRHADVLPRGRPQRRATGVPGAIAMLSMAHKDHGKKPWNSLFG